MGRTSRDTQNTTASHAKSVAIDRMARFGALLRRWQINDTDSDGCR